LPVEAQVFYKKPLDAPPEEVELYTQLYADLLEDTEGDPAFYETTPMTPPEADGSLPVVDLSDPTATVDGCLWIALLARQGDSLDDVREQIKGKVLTVGVMPLVDDEEGVVLEYGQITRSESRSNVRWEIAKVLPNSDDANYETLPAPQSSILNAPSLVELTLPSTKQDLTSWQWDLMEPGLEGTAEYPPSLADTNIGGRVITWIRLRLDRSSGNGTVKARISWLGINVTMMQQKVRVTGEFVGTGTGEPDQCFRLANLQVLPDTLELSVGEEIWDRVDDILTADPEVPVNDPRFPIYRSEAAIAAGAEPRTKVFTLDPESGDVCMGDGTHGARPKLGQRIVASYEFGGGRTGNVGIGMISRSPQLPASYKVNNPLPTWGGEDSQDVENAEKSIPRTVQHHDRLVSVQDFKDVTEQTPGVDIGRVEVVPLFDPTSPSIAQMPGVVTIMVIPDSPIYNTPQPDQFFLEAVCDHLQPRRLVTTELYVRGPEYKDIWVSVAIEVLGGYAAGPVSEAVRQELFRFLSPLYGGRSDTGWPLGVSVVPEELEAMVARVDGVRLVNSLLLGAETDGVIEIPIEGLMLPRLVGVSVVEGDQAVPISELRSAPPLTSDPETNRKSTPIPAFPARC
jgi:hypothetical protein